MQDKQNAQQLMDAATAAYGHKPSMAELFSFMASQSFSATALENKEENKFNPAQPRDGDGKWSDGGSSGSSSGGSTKKATKDVASGHVTVNGVKVHKELEGAAKDAVEMETYKEFSLKYEQNNLLDLSDYQNHRIGRIFAETGEGIQDTYDMALEYGHRGINQYKYEKEANVPDVDSRSEKVTVYRGTVNSQKSMQAGDYVSFNRDYADSHHNGDDYDDHKVLELTVPASDVIWQGNDLHEWVYSPKEIRGDYEGLEDFYNTVHNGGKAENDVEGKAENFNPHHDGQTGQFTSGTGGGSTGGVSSYRGRTAESATKYINDHYGDVEYSDDELRVINNYTGSMFARMNRTLRGASATHPINETADRAKQTADHIQIMDQAMTKTRLKTDTTLWRAATSSTELKVGQKITDKGYGSTSMREQVADVFLGQNMSSSKPVKYTMKIRAKAGQTGIFAQNAKNNSYENEFILPHDVTYTITKVKKVDEFYVVEADLS